MRHSFSFQAGHSVQLLQGSAQLFPALIAEMDQAQKSIWLETYIFDFHDGSAEVAKALMRAAKRGLDVRVVADGVGTHALTLDWHNALTQSGVNWRVFSPLGRLGLLLPSRWRRLHRKLCWIDNAVLFCGGINILDDLRGEDQSVLAQPRFDLAVKIKGPLVQDAGNIMAQLWWRMLAAQRAQEHHLTQAFSALQALQKDQENQNDSSDLNIKNHEINLNNSIELNNLDYLNLENPLKNKNQVDLNQNQNQNQKIGNLQNKRAALVLRDNVHNRNHIEKTYLQAIANAKKEIVIANAYFLPGRRLRKALVLAAKRGVRVCLLLQGKYDGFMQYHASKPVYGALLAANIEIYEYATSFLHAKVAVIDAKWSTIGSSNLDPLSLLLAREANVVIDDVQFANELREQLQDAITYHGVLLDPERYEQRPLHQRLLDRLAFGLVRFALWISGRHY